MKKQIVCPVCNGLGMRWITTGIMSRAQEFVECEDCDGTGRVEKHKEAKCH